MAAKAEAEKEALEAEDAADALEDKETEALVAVAEAVVVREEREADIAAEASKKEQCIHVMETQE